MDFFHKRAEMTKKVTGVARIKGAPVVHPRGPAKITRVGTFYDGESAVASLLLEVADTPEARAMGMMGRKDAPPVFGMLFDGLSGPGHFWMKNCLVPLDVAFMDKDGVVVKTYSMPLDEDGSKRYGYGDDVKSAVEVGEGMLAKWGVSAGCRLKTRLLKGGSDG